MKKFVYLILLLSIKINVNSQSIYYGQHNFGKIEIINDSLLQIDFLYHEFYFKDTCYYSKKNDTIWIYSKVKERFTINVLDYKPYRDSVDLTPIILKVYSNEYSKNHKYKLMYEYPEMYDFLNKEIIINDLILENEEIIVLDMFFDYERFKINFTSSENKFVIIKCNDYAIHIFNGFPLLIKNNRLIPISKEAQEKCWMENGFYFPKMQRSKKTKKYKRIYRGRVGLYGLPQGYDFPQKPKYIRDVEKP